MPIANASREFRTLEVRERAHQLALGCYLATKAFPKDELLGLTSQIRRAASSAPANIAERHGRGGNDLVRFCRIPFGSASELEYHLILARDLTYVTYLPLAEQTEEVKRMLSAFVDTLTADS